METILDKKGFKLFFHNKEANKTFPIGWTGTAKGMVAKCKKLLRENEGSHFEYTFEGGPVIKVEVEALIKTMNIVYIEVPEPKPVEIISNPESESVIVINKPETPEIYVKTKQAKEGYLFCSSKNCDHEIEVKGNLDYKLSNRIYLVCPECGHKTKVCKVKTTNALSYAIGDKGMLIRPNGPKKHLSKKARLRIKRREN